MKGIAATPRKRTVTVLCYINDLCGVAGFTKLNFRPGPERIRSAVQSIIHRGPDQQGGKVNGKRCPMEVPSWRSTHGSSIRTGTELDQYRPNGAAPTSQNKFRFSLRS